MAALTAWLHWLAHSWLYCQWLAHRHGCIAALARARWWRPTRQQTAAAGRPTGQRWLAVLRASGDRPVSCGGPSADRRASGGLQSRTSSGVSEPSATAARTTVAAVITVIDVAAVTVTIITAVGPQ